RDDGHRLEAGPCPQPAVNTDVTILGPTHSYEGVTPRIVTFSHSVSRFTVRLAGPAPAGSAPAHARIMSHLKPLAHPAQRHRPLLPQPPRQHHLLRTAFRQGKADTACAFKGLFSRTSAVRTTA